MRLILIRHGDPDYEKDSLTEEGWKEAAALAERVSQWHVDDFYVSPLGRAKDTASLTLQKMNRTAVELDWIREFWPTILRPDLNGERSKVVWDWKPDDWTRHPEFFDYDHWYENPVMQEGHAKEAYDEVCRSLDALLASYGYVHDGNEFRVEQENHKVVVMFCHFGIICTMLSHLLHVSPMVLWHFSCLTPSSVTELKSEERDQGIASFRILQLGDTSHLYKAGLKPAFAAQFVECYGDEGRH